LLCFVCVLSIITLTSCSNTLHSKVIKNENEKYNTTSEDYSNEVFKLYSSKDEIVIRDGTNYIIYHMKNGVSTGAEYAYQFGDNSMANVMYNYYEKNGYDPQYTSGYVNGIYLVMKYSDQSKYTGITAEKLKNEYTSEICSGYFE